MIIQSRHFKIIQAHLAQMYSDLTDDVLDFPPQTTRDLLAIVDDVCVFTEALQDIVAGLGTDAQPDVTSGWSP